jgi:copper chaperone CopZ
MFGSFVEKPGEFCQSEERFDAMRTKTAIISIVNLTADDLPAVKQALGALPGIDSIDFSVERSVAVIEFDPAQSHIDDFLRAVLKAGFKVQ